MKKNEIFRPPVNLKPLNIETKIGLNDYVTGSYNRASFLCKSV